MLLLCTYNVPALAAIQQPSQLDAIRKGRSLLALWAANPGIAANVAWLDSLMLAKGITPQEHPLPSPGYLGQRTPRGPTGSVDMHAGSSIYVGFVGA